MEHSYDLARFRRFARAVTSELGALDSSFLGRGRPLGAARLINAIGNGRNEISALREYLKIDSGLLSRLLRGLEADDLAEVSPDPADARRRLVRLTEAGQREFEAYERLSNDRAARLLDRHPDRAALLSALDVVASAIYAGEVAIQRTGPTSPEARHCLERYYDELRHCFDGGFEVERSRDPSAEELTAPRGSFLVAMSDGVPVGCVGLKGRGDGIAEVKRLWIAPSLRGLGLAKRLMDAVENEARALSIATLRLDTNRALPAAYRLYVKSGWTEIERFNDNPYAHHFFEKRLDAEVPEEPITASDSAR